MKRKLFYTILLFFVILVALNCRVYARITTSDPTVNSGENATITISSQEGVASGAINVLSDGGLTLVSTSGGIQKQNGTLVAFAKSENKKSGIGWIGICLIILLSIIVIYVLYVGFRYYKKKKYQNPSFYYKITEEMFEDITPIE